jgi:hypothetical protein
MANTKIVSIVSKSIMTIYSRTKVELTDFGLASNYRRPEDQTKYWAQATLLTHKSNVISHHILESFLL